MKKRLYVIILFVLIALSVSMYIIIKKNMATPKNNENTLCFINTKLFISGSVGEKITFPVIFFMNKQYEAKNIIDDVMLIDSSGAEISDWQLTEGSEYKNSKLNNISVVIKLKKEGQEYLKGLQIRYKDGSYKDFKFNDWFIDVMSNSPNNITVASKESYIASNHKNLFNIQNNSDKVIKISNLDLISDRIKLKNGIFTEGNKKYDTLSGIQLSKSDVLELNFETELSEKCDIYFIRPRLEYTLAGNTYKEPITQGAIYGLQFDEAKMSSMYEKYFDIK